MNNFLLFLFIFMSIEYLLYIIELVPYENMISHIQGYKFNFYKNLDNNFTFKNIIIYTFVYILLIYIIYYYIILYNKSLLEGFIFICILYSGWDICLFSCFDKGTKYWSLLLYDVFIVGGLCMLISQYLYKKYYNILNKYIYILFSLYLLTLFMFLYEMYRYNPNLSNIKGYVLF